MSGEVRALRNTDGSMGVIAFSDALLPLSEVHTRIEQPVACRLQTRETAGGPQNQRRFTPGDFYLHPNGSIIESSALATVGSMAGPLIVIHAGVQIFDAKIHPGVELEQGVVVRRGAEVHDGTYVGDTTEVGPNCSVGAKSRVGRESKLTNSKLGPNCAVGDGAIIINSIISGSLNAGRGLRLTKANVSSSVRLGNEFVSKTDLTLRDGVVFGDHALVGANVRVAPGVRAGEYCAIEDGVTIDDGVAIGPYVELGSRTRVDVGAALLGDTIVGEGAYIGPYIEVAGMIAAGSYLAYRQQPIPVWPIPRRTFDDSTKKQG